MTSEASKTPTVFISYSHDSPEHRRWVASLATKLRFDGIDVILDQWDLRPGEDVARFMEESIDRADRSVLICSEQYVHKAEAGVGGVGYERHIVTAEMIQQVGGRTFIPVVRQSSEQNEVPKFLSGLFYLDFSFDDQFDEKYDELLRELHNVESATKPPLGKSPFGTTPSGVPASLPATTALAPTSEGNLTLDELRTSAIQLARSRDQLGWRQLIKRVRPNTADALLGWRASYDRNPPKDEGELFAALDDALHIVAPLFVVALTGVESGIPEFGDQRAVVDEILGISKWNRSGRSVLVGVPETLVFFFQAMHGGLCVDTRQLRAALNLASMHVAKDDGIRDLPELWRQKHLTGWPAGLTGNATTAWKYLMRAFATFGWISDLFTVEDDYKASVSAYYMALNVHELADYLGKGGSIEALRDDQYFALDIPLCFASEPEKIRTKALAMLLRMESDVAQLWTSVEIDAQDMEGAWELWMKRCQSWISEVCGWGRSVPHRQLFPSRLSDSK